MSKKKKLTPEQKKRVFEPLQRYEIQQKILWFFFGAMTYALAYQAFKAIFG
jgi:hypothetical protein